MTRSHFLRQLIVVVGILLLQFLIRAHNITLQDPYIDEGFHVVRAAHIWDFEEHPGRFSHGKVLVYFWMGLFRLTPETGLYVSRTSIALFSLITGATLYALARRLYDHPTGAVTLALYAILPLAFFYERMAMADPLAAGLSALVAWRCLVFVRRPTRREGARIGALLALALLAKLTMGLLPLLMPAAVLIFRKWNGSDPVRLRAYLVPMIIAATVMGLIWSFMLIPAAIAGLNGHPFRLVDSFNLRDSAPHRITPESYITQWLPLIIDMTGPGLLAACVFVWIGQVMPFQSGRNQRGGGYLFAWFMLICLLPVLGARLITLRYFMAASGPLVILLARGVTLVWVGADVNLRIARPVQGGLWSRSYRRVPDFTPKPTLWKVIAPPLRVRGGSWGLRVIRLALLTLIPIWLVTYALPFLWTEWHTPLDLPLRNTNYTEYISGFLSADDGVRAGAVTINQLEPDAPLYANWALCHMWYFYTDRELDCLDLDYPLQSLRDYLRRDLVQPGDEVYLALTGYKPFFTSIKGLCWEEIASHERPRITRPVGIWRLWRGAC